MRHITREDFMKSLIRCMFALIFGLMATAPAHADLKVATSLTDLASVAQFVGGKHVSAQSLCRGFEDPHFVPAKPSLMKEIGRASCRERVEDAVVWVSV